jgi:hypothetical protein
MSLFLIGPGLGAALSGVRPARGTRLCLAILGASFLGLACAAPDRVLGPTAEQPKTDAAASLDSRAEHVRRDPVAYLREVRDGTARLDHYTLTLTRQERRGLIKTLRNPERIQAWFRREPFSVRFKWLDPDVKYGESTFVRGQHNDQVRFIPRHGLFGLPPGITAVDLQTPVTWGEARYPVTDFGLERMMERTLESIRLANGDYIVEYRGLRTLDNGAIAHHIWMRFPPSRHPAPVQELFVDARTDLPVMTLIKHDSGDLEAAYQYENVNTRIRLTDEDFLLDAERDKGAEQPPQAPPDGAGDGA